MTEERGELRSPANSGDDLPVCPVIRSFSCYFWMGIPDPLCKRRACGFFHQMWRRACKPAWTGWKSKLKPGEFPHPSHHIRNHQTEFHLHDRSFPPFHHSSLAKWNISVAVLGLLLRSHQIPLWSFFFFFFFMSCIDYAVENCFAVLVCFNGLETAKKSSEKKTFNLHGAGSSRDICQVSDLV